MPSPQHIQLLHEASDKAKILLQGLKRDQAALGDHKQGRSVFKAAVDATRSTMDNLQRAIEDASEVKSD